jgi:hypothetical protein
MANHKVRQGRDPIPAIPRRWLSGWLLPRWLPDRWFDRLVARQL